LYLHAPLPWLQLPLTLVRKLHLSFAAILLANFAVHLYYYLVSGRISEVLYLPRDWVNTRAFLRYMLFITADHPNFGRYNPGQKLFFMLWGLAVIAAAVTGTALAFPDDSLLPQRCLGGLGGLRIIHYLTAVLFVVTVPWHIYLAFAEDPARLQAMFTGYVQKEAPQTVPDNPKIG
jgi:Ni/Fe-hydrogenase 1 B-type cytochrome subunit